MQVQFLTQAQLTHPDLPLGFSGVLVIVGGGDVDGAVLRALHADGATIIGADGGADACLAFGIMPAAIIGDMDSLADPTAWRARTQLIQIDEQHTTDFEKCLYATEAPVTIALGMTGKRLDHTLAALDAASRYAANRTIIFVDVDDLALVAAGPVAFEVAAGERVSVHPLGRVKFASSTGLEYPLGGLTLAPGVATGASNCAVEGPFTIEPLPGGEAAWLLILDRKHLQKLVRQGVG